jgi:hypothetical protein
LVQLNRSDCWALFQSPPNAARHVARANVPAPLLQASHANDPRRVTVVFGAWRAAPFVLITIADAQRGAP